MSVNDGVKKMTTEEIIEQYKQRIKFQVESIETLSRKLQEAIEKKDQHSLFRQNAENQNEALVLAIKTINKLVEHYYEG